MRRGSRRFVVVGGILALTGLYVLGGAFETPRIEDDLEQRVHERLAVDAQISVSFSGQNGTLRCALPLDAPDRDRFRADALGVWGVNDIEWDASCTGGETSSASNTSVATSTSLIMVDPTLPPSTTSSTTTTAVTTTTVTTTTVAPAPATLLVQLVDGRLVLNGSVANDLEHLALVQRAQGAVDPRNVIDQLIVDPAVGALPPDRFEAFTGLMTAMPGTLVNGQVQWNGGIAASGTFVDEAHGSFFMEIALAAGVEAVLDERPAATPEQAAALETELNALVATEPILFDKGSTTISLASLATVQHVAGMAKRYSGVAIVVQGHTDSEGDPGRNQTLSEQRAAAVLDALVAQGVPAQQLTSQGFGLTQLVRDAAGNEIPEQSRRVVFAVTAT